MLLLHDYLQLARVCSQSSWGDATCWELLGLQQCRISDSGMFLPWMVGGVRSGAVRAHESGRLRVQRARHRPSSSTSITPPAVTARVHTGTCAISTVCWLTHMIVKQQAGLIQPLSMKWVSFSGAQDWISPRSLLSTLAGTCPWLGPDDPALREPTRETCRRIARRTLSVKACLKPLSLLAVPVAAVTAGAGAALTPDAVAGVVTTAAASLAFAEAAAGAGAPAALPAAGTPAVAGKGLPAAAAVEPPSSGAALW